MEYESAIKKNKIFFSPSMIANAGERLGGGGIEKKGKRTYGCGQLCGDC